jgi:hypothetical protein
VPRCLMCLAPVTAEGCLCSGSELRTMRPAWTRCNCGCEQADAYNPATDPRKCPGCGATRSSASDSCGCGYRRSAPMTGKRALEILIEKRQVSHD